MQDVCHFSNFYGLQCNQTQIFNLFPQVTSNHEADFAFVLEEELKDGSFLLFHQILWNSSGNIFSRLKSYFLLILAPWQFFFVILESFFKREQSCNDFYLLQTLFIFQKGKTWKSLICSRSIWQKKGSHQRTWRA